MIGLMTDEFGGLIMKKIAVLKAKTYSYLKDNNDEDKKVKSTKCVSQKENLNLKIINNV